MGSRGHIHAVQIWAYHLPFYPERSNLHDALCARPCPPSLFFSFTMLLHIVYKLSLIFAGFSLALLTRYILHCVAIRRAFRHLPGPPPSSLVWGEEWKLYTRIPGSLYTDWHGRFGNLLVFTGAFGVLVRSLENHFCTSNFCFVQHQILSVTDSRAISYILGDGAYQFPKTQGVRTWFQATLGEGILWVEGWLCDSIFSRCISQFPFRKKATRAPAAIFGTDPKVRGPITSRNK